MRAVGIIFDGFLLFGSHIFISHFTVTHTQQRIFFQAQNILFNRRQFLGDLYTQCVCLCRAIKLKAKQYEFQLIQREREFMGNEGNKGCC